MGDNKRLPVELFQIPVDKIKSGWYADKYFNRTKYILEQDNHNPEVIYQVFQKNDAVLCGVDEAVAIIKTCCDDPDDLEIKALRDGDSISPWENVIEIKTHEQNVVHLETEYLGVMARQTAIASTVRKIINAANSKPVLFFGARFDHYKMQPIDGYAAFKAGIKGVSTDANAWWQEDEGIGTIPHALIAGYGGDTVKAALKFDKYIEPEVDRIVLSDWDNDCVQTTIGVAMAFKEQAMKNRDKNRDNDLGFISFIGSGKGKLWGTRFDTSEKLRDKSVPPISKELSCGVCAMLVWEARKRFDVMGLNGLKICVTGGFDIEKISAFEKMGVPVDVYGVGSSMYKYLNCYNFTSDIVVVDGKRCAKVGRGYNPNPRLEIVK